VFNTAYTGNAPSIFFLLGSNNGTNWELVFQQYPDRVVIASETEKEFTISATKTFRYFRLVVSFIGSSGAVPIAANATLRQLTFYGATLLPNGISEIKSTVDFNPPQNLIGKKVYMQLKSASLNTSDLPIPFTTRIPFFISLMDFNQPYGIEHDDRSFQLGTLVSNTRFQPGPIIITTLPDGPQTLTFKILSSDSSYHQDGMLFCLMLAFQQII